jgi:acyl-CoA synthetase (AMP-forming)/AMP-acid ligase II
VNLIELFAHHVRERPDSPAIIDRRQTVSFAELDEASRRRAATLAADGLRAGDIVLVLCPIGIPLYTALLGILRLGLVAMFVDPSAGRAHLDQCCDLVRPRAFLGTRRAHLYRLLSRAVRRIAIHRGLAFDAGRLALSPIEPVEPEAPALLTFTTGSTGTPKAAVRTHGFLLAQHRAVSDTLGLTPGDLDLTTLPMFGLANLASGVTSVIADADLRRPGAIDPAPVILQIRRHRPTRVTASPAFLDRLVSHCLARGETLDSFTRVFTGGGPVFPRLLDSLGVIAPNAETSAVYGSTEAEPIARLDRRDLGIHDRSATRQGKGLLTGRPVSSVRVRILPDRWREPLPRFTEEQFARAILPAGEAGEIVVAGDHVLSGYLHGRGDREHKFSVGGERWHRTGDAGYLDTSGRLWLLGRSAAAVEDRRGRMYPFAVEAAAEECAGVERAALVGDNGRRILAVQIGGVDEHEVRAALDRSLHWAALDEVRIVRRIPVDPRHNAKVDYERLRASEHRSNARRRLLGVLRQGLLPHIQRRGNGSGTGCSDRSGGHG